jgi:hypothetical protein
MPFLWTSRSSTEPDFWRRGREIQPEGRSVLLVRGYGLQHLRQPEDQAGGERAGQGQGDVEQEQPAS